MTPRLLCLILLASLLCASCSTSPSWKPRTATIDEIKGSGCQVRYHYREHLANDEPSAPASSDRPLPPWKIMDSGNHVASIEGKAEGLPYDFRIYLQKSRKPGQLQLMVNITDNGNAVKGFPAIVDNALPKIKDGVDFEVPVSDALKKQIEARFFEKDDFLTYVNVIIRTGEP